MFAAERIAYRQTGAFSKLVLDYLDGSERLAPFYTAPPTVRAIQNAIEDKSNTAINREILVAVLQDQYQSVSEHAAVSEAINLLAAPTTFTICTAHQPNLATGPFYFIYKIVHAIKLAQYLQEQLPQYQFVPVYYMGCEDADLKELNHFAVNGKKYQWNTEQKGAVGRMNTDAELLSLLDELEGQLGVAPFGKEWCALLQDAYTKGIAIQEATFRLVHQLFARHGLVVLISDDARLKAPMLSVFKDDIFKGTASSIVTNTSQRLNQLYKVQAYPREINLFYLKGDIRQRIVQNGDGYKVHDTDIAFSKEELVAELEQYPERFSPNVILRGLFQETILPNVVFVGGGGELSYWLQLKDLFQHYGVPFPIQVLRNSFLIVNKKQNTLLQNMGLQPAELFKTEQEILNGIVEKNGVLPSLSDERERLQKIYNVLQSKASLSDATLAEHVAALHKKAVSHLGELEKKMLRAERKKLATMQQRIHTLRALLFPSGGLQERTENVGAFYALWGSSFIDSILDNSLALEQQFTILQEL